MNKEESSVFAFLFFGALALIFVSACTPERPAAKSITCDNGFAEVIRYKTDWINMDDGIISWGSRLGSYNGRNEYIVPEGVQCTTEYIF